MFVYVYGFILFNLYSPEQYQIPSFWTTKSQHYITFFVTDAPGK